MDFKMHMYVVIWIERQQQKYKKERKIPQLLIQDAREISWQYIPTFPIIIPRQGGARANISSGGLWQR